MKLFQLIVAVVLFVSMLALSWLYHGEGVIKNDLKRNIYIPEVLTMPLQVKAAYNGEKIFFRYRWPAKRPYIYHDMLKYEGGKWVRYGTSIVGPQPQGIYEDRVTMLVDDGSVPAFAKYGGYITVGDRSRFFTNAAGKKEVKAHPYLGKQKNKKDVRKYLPATRKQADDWASVVSQPELTALRKAGYFLDLWHWRAHRGSPIGKSDDQYVAEYRYGDAGKGVYYTNWDKQRKQPRFMYDKLKAGRVAFRWRELERRTLGFNDFYYLAEEDTVPFDPNFAWREGDVLPRRILRRGSGSHADISVHGKARWKDGYWDVSLVRAMDTGNPLDDKIFMDKRLYTVAFAVHRDATGSRWHYVSLPFQLGLKREAELPAKFFQGDSPGWKQPWLTVTLFYPGQVNWPLLVSKRHAGAEQIRQQVPVRYWHNEEQLAHYGVEMEFNDEIIRQWLYTLFAGLFLIIGLGFAVNRLVVNKE